MHEADPVCDKSAYHGVVEKIVDKSLASFGTEAIYRNKQNSLKFINCS